MIAYTTDDKQVASLTVGPSRIDIVALGGRGKKSSGGIAQVKMIGGEDLDKHLHKFRQQLREDLRCELHSAAGFTTSPIQHSYGALDDSWSWEKGRNSYDCRSLDQRWRQKCHSLGRRGGCNNYFLVGVATFVGRPMFIRLLGECVAFA